MQALRTYLGDHEFITRTVSKSFPTWLRTTCLAAEGAAQAGVEFELWGSANQPLFSP